MPKISVIVPVYKVEAYLERCVESILNQTYRNLEVILVDDGSPDGCGAICDAYVQKDNRVRVIHKQNGGLSSARNAGMEIASGEYIAFVDSDDTIDKNFLETLHGAMQRLDADLVECGRVDHDSPEPQPEEPETGAEMAYTLPEAMAFLIENSRFHQTVWNKLYKREILSGQWFPPGKIHEDEYFTWQVFLRCKRLGVVDRRLYHYYHRAGSIMETDFSPERLRVLEARMERHRYICENLPQLERESKFSLAFPCMCLLQKAYASGNRQVIETAKKETVACLKSLRLTWRDIRSLSPKNQVWMSLCRVSLPGCCRLRHRLHKPC